MSAAANVANKRILLWYFDGEGHNGNAYMAFNEAHEHVAKQLRRLKRALREDKPVNETKANVPALHTERVEAPEADGDELPMPPHAFDLPDPEQILRHYRVEPRRDLLLAADQNAAGSGSQGSSPDCLSEPSRRGGVGLPEGCGHVRLAGETAGQGDRGQIKRGRDEHIVRARQPPLQQIAVRRHSRRRLEGAREVLLREAYLGRDLGQRQVSGHPGLHELLGATQPPGRQARQLRLGVASTPAVEKGEQRQGRPVEEEAAARSDLLALAPRAPEQARYGRIGEGRLVNAAEISRPASAALHGQGLHHLGWYGDRHAPRGEIEIELRGCAHRHDGEVPGTDPRPAPAQAEIRLGLPMPRQEEVHHQFRHGWIGMAPRRKNVAAKSHT